MQISDQPIPAALPSAPVGAHAVPRSFIPLRPQPELPTLPSMMPGIHIAGSGDREFWTGPVDIDILLVPSVDESEAEFTLRAVLTKKLLALVSLQLNVLAAVNLGHLLCTKMKYNIMYDERIENVLTNVLTML